MTDVGRAGDGAAAAVPPPARTPIRTVLADPDIRRVELAWAGCIVAEFAVLTALGVHALREGGVVAIGAVALARALPAALAAPVVAAAVDRVPRALALTVVLACRVVTLGGAAAAVALGLPLALVVTFAALDAVAYSAFWPGQSSLLVELAHEPTELSAANAVSTSVENVGGLVGPVIAGVLFAVTGPAGVLLVSTLLVGAGAATMSGVRRIRPAPAPRTHVTAELLTGVRHLRRDRAARAVVLVYLAQTTCLGAVNTLVVVLALDVLGLAESGAGFLAAALGAGGIVGSLLTLRAGAVAGSARRLTSVLVLWGACLAVAAALDVVPAAVAGLLGVGVANALVDVLALSLLQRLVADDVLGRVLGVFEGLWWAAMGLGAAAASVLAQATGTRTATLLVACVLPVLAIVARSSLSGVDASLTSLAGTVGLLRRIPVLAPLGPLALERLALTARPAATLAGDDVVRLGDVGDIFFVLTEGEALVARCDGSTRALLPGEGFGEIALLHDVPRTATVRAVTDLSLLSIDRAHFLGALAAARTRPRG